MLYPEFATLLKKTKPKLQQKARAFLCKIKVHLTFYLEKGLLCYYIKRQTRVANSGRFSCSSA